MVGFSVVYYKMMVLVLIKTKMRTIYYERDNFHTGKVFYRFLLWPWDIIRITWKSLKVYRMNSMEYHLYTLKRTDPKAHKVLKEALNQRNN